MKKSTLICLVILAALHALEVDCSYNNQLLRVKKPPIKQCVFKNLNEEKDIGHITSCRFTKVDSDSALRVTYQGDMRMIGCSGACCSRWYITINGKECSSPATIEALLYASGSANRHIPVTLDGFCNNVWKGEITVGLSVGRCTTHKMLGNAYTGWDTVSRLIIEEVPALQ